MTKTYEIKTSKGTHSIDIDYHYECTGEYFLHSIVINQELPFGIDLHVPLGDVTTDLVNWHSGYKFKTERGLKLALKRIIELAETKGSE